MNHTICKSYTSIRESDIKTPLTELLIYRGLKETLQNIILSWNVFWKRDFHLQENFLNFPVACKSQNSQIRPSDMRLWILWFSIYESIRMYTLICLNHGRLL